jgi:hypothetical protein
MTTTGVRRPGMRRNRGALQTKLDESPGTFRVGHFPGEASGGCFGAGKDGF